MQKDSYIEALLNDFVLHDCRLGSHPKFLAEVWWLEHDLLHSVECTTRHLSIAGDRTLRIDEGVAGYVLTKGQHVVVLDADYWPYSSAAFLQIPKVSSILGMPLFAGPKKLGVLSIYSFETKAFSEQDIIAAQLLAVILSYARTQDDHRRVSPVSTALGAALKGIRERSGVTQDQLAARIGTSRIALSRWEAGTQPPSRGPLRQWCSDLGLLSSTSGTLVTFVEITTNLLKLLKEDPTRLSQLSPSQFENFIAERLDRMGFDVNLTGSTNRKDGGIDLIAIPKMRTVGAFLLAGQIKHHQGGQKTGRDAVDRLLAWNESPFRVGLLVTNTGFTQDAKWLAEQERGRSFLKLRDFDDLKRWLEDNFWSEKDWREIPEFIELAPGVKVAVPKPRLEDKEGIWTLPKLDLKKYGDSD